MGFGNVARDKLFTEPLQYRITPASPVPYYTVLHAQHASLQNGRNHGRSLLIPPFNVHRSSRSSGQNGYWFSKVLTLKVALNSCLSQTIACFTVIFFSYTVTLLASTLTYLALSDSSNCLKMQGISLWRPGILYNVKCSSLYFWATVQRLQNGYHTYDKPGLCVQTSWLINLRKVCF